MSIRSANLGDLVQFPAVMWGGAVGVVSQPITAGNPGHVLMLQGEHLLGVSAWVDDVELADDESAGFAQLETNLIKRGSLVLEKRLIVYRA
jgi:hypothetical protein